MNMAEWRDMIRGSDHIVFFGGAGTSTESGIPDFRSADGLYQMVNGTNISPEEILSRDFFMNDPASFYEFYKNKMIYPDARPNPAHQALAELERQGRLKAVITQNIDGLHQMAGSINVLELHGSVHRNYCMQCRTTFSLDELLRSKGDVPRCTQCDGIIRPDVVLYQERLDQDVLQRAAAHIHQADVLIIAGTSLTVQPAAGLIRYYRGERCILINKSETPLDHLAHVVIRDSIAQTLHQLLA